MNAESRIAAALAALATGDVVVVVDDPGKGADAAALAASAAGLAPGKLAFMVRHSSGIVCAAMRSERLDQLRIPGQSGADQISDRPVTAVSVDLRDGITTGISSSDRAATLRALADPRSIAEDLVRPGHVLPIRCEQGGVLDQPCVEQAALDLCELASLAPCAAFAAVTSDTGNEPDREVALRLAAEHDLPWVSVGELGRYRRHTESHVGQAVAVALPTAYGTFRAMCFGYERDSSDHLVLQMGDPVGEDVLVAVHAECVAGDVLGSLSCGCAAALEGSLRMISDAGRGLIIYLRERKRAGLELAHMLEGGCAAHEERDETIAAHILRDLGVRSVTLITDNPAGRTGPTGYGVTVNRRIPVADRAADASRSADLSGLAEPVRLP
jgi:3,4-dihydroxy 2-butanone 4-phosphate synthase/GTP cyclohydrolase II